MIRALDIGSNVVYRYDNSYRCGSSPSKMFAPPNLTTEDTFDPLDIRLVAECLEGEKVYIEWPDCFYKLNAETNTYVFGPHVWRAAQIISNEPELDEKIGADG